MHDMVRRGVWDDRSLTELDALFSLWDERLPDIFEQMTEGLL
jgi:hypothetical protein